MQKQKKVLYDISPLTKGKLSILGWFEKNKNIHVELIY